MTRLQIVPTSWDAFRTFRQISAPMFKRRHGNFRHGHYSKRGIEGMREVRLLAASFDTRCGICRFLARRSAPHQVGQPTARRDDPARTASCNGCCH